MDGKNILDKLLSGIDVTKLISEFAPSLTSTIKGRKMGRPHKVKWDDKVAKGVVGGKLGLAFLGASVLLHRGDITAEHIWVVMGYTSERITSLPLADCFPSSNKWIVREALESFGVSDVPSVSWDEMIGVLTQMAQSLPAGRGGVSVDAQTMATWLQAQSRTQSHVRQQPMG